MFIRSVIFIVFAFAFFGVSASSAQTTQKVTIKVGAGFRPSSFKLKKGVPAKLTFIRTTDRTCGKQVTLPDYGITEDLPLNQTVDIAFTPTQAGTFSFTCGMHMLRGKIVVTQ